jgi:hypothetical protein
LYDYQILNNIPVSGKWINYEDVPAEEHKSVCGSSSPKCCVVDM